MGEAWEQGNNVCVWPNMNNLHGMKMGGPRSLEIAAAPLPFPGRAGMASAGVIPREPPRIIP